MIERRLDDGVLTLTLARPEKLNALSPQLVARLAEEFTAAAAEESVRVVVLAGAGRSFCAGADVCASLAIDDPDAAARFLDDLVDLLRLVAALPQPVIAAVQGHAVGGGAELALEADLRVVAEDARLFFPDVALGSTPATMQPLVRLAGRGLAMEMALLGTELDAAAMRRAGIANQLVPAAELQGATQALAERLRDHAGARQLRYAKESVRLAEERSREADLRANAAAMLACHHSPQQRAYVRGFGRG